MVSRKRFCMGAWHLVPGPWGMKGPTAGRVGVGTPKSHRTPALFQHAYCIPCTWGLIKPLVLGTCWTNAVMRKFILSSKHICLPHWLDFYHLGLRRTILSSREYAKTLFCEWFAIDSLSLTLGMNICPLLSYCKGTAFPLHGKMPRDKDACTKKNHELNK